MLHDVIDDAPVSRLAPIYQWPWGTAQWVVLCLLLLFGVAQAWAQQRAAIPNLGNPHHLQLSGLYTDWAKGSVIVVLRHAERCDRSNEACLNDPSGITVAGRQAATDVGLGLQHLGLGAVDVWTSPEVRTRQTAQVMFGKTIATQDWLNQCDGHFAENAFALKRKGHNLVLVSHSGCMEQLEQALKAPFSATANSYASALFFTRGNDGKTKVLGQMAANEWHTLIDAKEL